MPAPAKTGPVVETKMEEIIELNRIRSAYARRRSRDLFSRYAWTNPAHLNAMHERESAIAALLPSAGIMSFASLRVLDVGCGRGATLRQLLDYGADPERLTGIDLLHGNVHEARRLSPHLKIICGSASQLPFPDASFDFVLQFLLFTSVLSPGVRQQIAKEISRVLASGGKLLWFDFAFNNPLNQDVRGVGRSEIRQLFPDFTIRTRRIIVAPPLARLLGRFSPALYYLAAATRFLCTHYLCLLEKMPGKANRSTSS
jgi:SAM-dependent methyltransferase